MKLNELFTYQDGIFKLFYDNFQTDFEAIFENVTAQNLDVLTLDLYQNRELRNIYVSREKINTSLLSFFVINIPRWKEYITLINETNDLQNVSHETYRKTGTLSTQGNETRLSAAKVFNDTEFINDTQDTNTDAKTDTYNITEIREKNENILKNIENVLYFKKQNTIFAIIKEIIDYITLKIY